MRTMIRMLYYLDRSWRGLEQVISEALKWVAGDSNRNAVLFVAVKAFFGFPRFVFAKARTIIYLSIAAPYIPLAAYVWLLLNGFWGTEIWIPSTIIVCAGLWLQTVNRSFKYWGIGWGYKLLFPSRYFEVSKRTYAGTVDERHHSYTSPILGVPRLTETGVQFSVSPGIGRTLEELDGISDSLAAQFGFIREIEIGYENSAASVGNIDLILDKPRKSTIRNIIINGEETAGLDERFVREQGPDLVTNEKIREKQTTKVQEGPEPADMLR